jgi:hypothetical protein
MDADQMTRLILATGLASQPGASLDHLTEFLTLDQMLRAEQENDHDAMRRIIRHLRTIDPDRAARGRFQAALWNARQKCRIKLPKTTAGANTTAAGGGAQRMRRSKKQDEDQL